MMPTDASALRLGRLFFGLAILGTGLQHLVARDFAARMFPDSSGFLAGKPALALLFGLLLALLGAALAANRKARAAGLVLAALLAHPLVALHLPRIAARPGMGGVWTNPAKSVVFLATALLLARLGAGSAAAPESTRRTALWARLAFSGFLILCGVQHFVYADFVATLVPAWVPGHTFWTYFTGTALIAGGAGLLHPKTAPLAARLTALMIFAWFLLLHLPRAFAAPGEHEEWSGVCESLAMSGVALLLAGNPGRPRNAAREREDPASL
jgi:uncharacterized membrane protein